MIAAQREMDSGVFAIGRRHARTSDVARLTVRCLAMTRRALEDSAVNLVVGIHTRLRWRRNLWDGLALEGLLRSGEGRNAMIVAVEIASRACTYTRCTTCFRN